MMPWVISAAEGGIEKIGQGMEVEYFAKT